jgi:hypothetical protein
MSAQNPANGKKQVKMTAQPYATSAEESTRILKYKSGFKNIPLINPATKLHSSISKAALELTHLRLLPYLVANHEEHTVVIRVVASNSYPAEKLSGW